MDDIESKIYIEQLLNSLSPRGQADIHERNVEMWKAYVLDGLTLLQVSNEFGFSHAERTRQVVGHINRRLKKKVLANA